MWIMGQVLLLMMLGRIFMCVGTQILSLSLVLGLMICLFLGLQLMGIPWIGNLELVEIIIFSTELSL